MADHDATALGDAAATMGVPLSAHQANQLLDYQALLARWNRVYNLTAVRDAPRMGSHHLLDSLSVVAPLCRHAAGRALRVLDVGSGGGLPGVVLAIARPDWDVTCIDAVAKKAGFLTQAAMELGLPNLHAHHARVQDLPPAQADIVISRAFASLADFTAWTRPHLAREGVWLAMKGRHPADEIDALPSDVQVFHVEPLQVPGLDAERCAIWLRPDSAPTAQSA
jgi:16S rRNA (guanine527-N7)-methyltransferase